MESHEVDDDMEFKADAVGVTLSGPASLSDATRYSGIFSQQHSANVCIQNI